MVSGSAALLLEAFGGTKTTAKGRSPVYRWVMA
jgi:hypothetical protein